MLVRAEGNCDLTEKFHLLQHIFIITQAPQTVRERTVQQPESEPKNRWSRAERTPGMTAEGAQL